MDLEQFVKLKTTNALKKNQGMSTPWNFSDLFKKNEVDLPIRTNKNLQNILSKKSKCMKVMGIKILFM